MRRFAFIIALLSVMAQAQITVVNHAGRAQASSVAINTAATAPSLIVVICGSYTSAATGITETGATANTWFPLTARGTASSPYQGYVRFFYAYAPNTGTSHVFTCTMPDSKRIEVLAMTGTGTTSAVYDKETGVNNGSQPGSLTPASSGEIFITANADASSAGTTDTINLSFTVADFIYDATNGVLGTAYYVNAGSGALNPLWTYIGSSAVAMAAFKPGAATAGAPTFSPIAGTFTSVQTVTLSSTTAGATFCSTVDGTTPTANGAGTCTHGATGATVSVGVNETVKAIASKSGIADSSVTSAAYVFQGSVPTFSPGAGLYSTTQTVTISQAQSLSMCYRTDGTAAASNGSGSCASGSTPYSAPISVSSSETVSAVAMASGWTDAVASAQYTMSPITLLAHGAGINFPPGSTITSVNNAGVFQGTFTGCAANACAGTVVTVTGFVNSANNVNQVPVTASTATSFTVNAVTITETHSALTAATPYVARVLNTTGASLIVLACTSLTAISGNPYSNPSVGTWTNLTVRGGVSFSGYLRISYVYSPTTNANQIFECSDNSYSTSSMTVSVWQGTLAGSDPIDGQSGSNSTYVPGTITPTIPGDLFITAFGNGNASTTVFSVNGGFAVSDSSHNGTSGQPDVAQAYAIDGTTAAENPSWAGSNGSYETTAMAAFKLGSSQFPFVTVIGVGP